VATFNCAALYKDGKIHVLTYVVTPTPSPPGAVRRRLGIPKPQTAAPRTALARVRDFKSFERLGIITPYDAVDGDAPNVVFSEEAVVVGDQLLMFYGAADKVCCVASAPLDEFVTSLLEGGRRT